MNKDIGNMSEFYYEKADENIIRECETFIKEYNKDTHSYVNYKKALTLEVNLINSLLQSHKEFEDRVETEVQKVVLEENELKKEFLITAFNNGKIFLILDCKAHRILNKLEEIKLEYKPN